MPNGDPAEPYADNTQLCCALLMSPVRFPQEFRQLKIDDDKTILFFSIVPLYKEEMELKLERGTAALFEGFDKYGVNELLDLKRRNVCKKGWW
jgi:Suppressor of fused protein (SUFU)